MCSSWRWTIWWVYPASQDSPRPCWQAQRVIRVMKLLLALLRSDRSILLALEFMYAEQLYIRGGNGALRREGWPLRTCSPWQLAVCIVCWGDNHLNLGLLEAGFAVETLTGPLYRLNLIFRFPGSQGVISCSLGLHISSLKRSQAGVTPLCSVHSILFAAQTLPFKLPIIRRPTIIPQIGVVELEQGEDLTFFPLSEAKGIFLLEFREPILSTLTWKPWWELVSHHLPQRWLSAGHQTSVGDGAPCVQRSPSLGPALG